MPIGENIEIIIKRTLFEAVGHGRNAAAVLEWAPAVLIVTWLGLKLYGRLDEASFQVVVLDGTFEITVLSDGHLTVPTRLLARNVTDAEIKSTIGVSNDTVEPHCNVTLVRTPSDTILIDVAPVPI